MGCLLQAFKPFPTFWGRVVHPRSTSSSKNQSPGIQPPHNDYSALSSVPKAAQKPGNEQSSSQQLVPEHLIRASILDIAENPTKGILVDSLQSGDAQCIVDYLDQLLSEDSASPLSARQRRHLLNLLAKIARTAQVFPATRELTGVVCNLAEPHTKGEFSYVYRGTYKGRDVCVKAIRRWQQHDEALDCFIQAQAREVTLLSSLTHQNIVPFYGIFDSSEGICLISPWMENGDLNRFLKTSSLIPRIPLICDIAAGLQYLHESAVVHGDLKGENILISDDGRAVITDFGMSNIAMTVPTRKRKFGATNWMAPELQFEDAPLPTMESDIWALGCICYEILTEQSPFTQYDVVEKESGLRAVDAQVRTILEGCWRKDPRLRPTAEQLCRSMGRVGLTDDRPTTDYHPRFFQTTRPDAEVYYERLRHILSNIMETPAEHIESRSDNLTSRVKNKALVTSGGFSDNDAVPLVRDNLTGLHDLDIIHAELKAISAPILRKINLRTPSGTPPLVWPARPSTASNCDSNYNELKNPLSTSISSPTKPAMAFPIPVKCNDGLQSAGTATITSAYSPMVDLTGLIRRDGGIFPLHSGGDSDVYTGSLMENPSCKVAIKVLRFAEGQEIGEKIGKYFTREAVVWHQLRHKNILPFLGLANDLGRYGNCPALIAPYCSRGTASDYFRHSNPTIETRLRLILGVAQGLEYLHGESIVHGDLKPSNILISDSGEPLICDFGRSKVLGLRGFTTKPTGTVRYQARELLEGTGTTNKSTDVCAFGLTAFEFWTGYRPYNEIHNEYAVLRHVILGDAQPQLVDPPPRMAEILWPILVPCFNHTPELRPTMQVMKQQLESCTLSR